MMKERKGISSELTSKLEKRKEAGQFRKLSKNDSSLADFSSNDYLGLARESAIAKEALKILEEDGFAEQNGARGSRLLNGNHALFEKAENFLADHHHSESALIYNSGYTANIGLLTAVLTRNSIAVYDELIHASLRDAIHFSHARSYRFAHNELDDLEKKLKKARSSFPDSAIYLVTEAVFSMDGDVAPLGSIKRCCQEQDAYLIIDEAHATATPVHEEIENEVKEFAFARILTFGKSLGVHGACVLSSRSLREYLINFSRSFIYTTALAPHCIASLLASYAFLKENPERIQLLEQRIAEFRAEIQRNELQEDFLESRTPIQSFMVRDSVKAKELENELRRKGFDIRAILSPTVPQGTERLRICLHSFNTDRSIRGLINFLKYQIWTYSSQV